MATTFSTKFAEGDTVYYFQYAPSAKCAVQIIKATVKRVYVEIHGGKANASYLVSGSFNVMYEAHLYTSIEEAKDAIFTIDRSL